METLAICLTCHNRIAKTLKCLQNLHSQDCLIDYSIEIYLVDDGSTDGTAEAVRKSYPKVNLIEGDGTLFWNRGMHRAFGAALQDRYNYYLWLNDDTFLYPNALRTMLDAHADVLRRGNGECIIVGSTVDPNTGQLSYGGYQRTGSSLNPLSFNFVAPQESIQECDSLCGNCVLISDSVSRVVGNIDAAYGHRYGDVDYGLRARNAGISIFVAPGYVGECEGNEQEDAWRNPKLPITKRLKELHSFRGLNKKDWLRFVRKHGGRLWPAIWVKPYVRLVADTFKQ